MLGALKQGFTRHRVFQPIKDGSKCKLFIFLPAGIVEEEWLIIKNRKIHISSCLWKYKTSIKQMHSWCARLPGARYVRSLYDGGQQPVLEDGAPCCELILSTLQTWFFFFPPPTNLFNNKRKVSPGKTNDRYRSVCSSFALSSAFNYVINL